MYTITQPLPSETWERIISVTFQLMAAEANLMWAMKLSKFRLGLYLDERLKEIWGSNLN